MRVLIVEDEPNLGEIFRDFLAGAGHEAAVVGSAETALARLRRAPPDAIVLDVKLPGMSGVDFLRLPEVRETGVAIVVVSGVATEEQARECLRLGALEFLAKPVPLNLLATVLEYLEPFTRLPREERRQAERRRTLRVPVELPIRVVSPKGRVWTGTCVEVSATGLRARLDAKTKAGSTLRLTVTVPDGGPAVDAVALVVRADDDGAAFWFLDLLPQEAQRLLAAGQKREGPG